MRQVATLIAALSPMRGLVIGCGNGTEVVELMQLTSASIIGIDQNSTFLEEARLVGDLLVADALALPFPDGYFDFAVSHHVLEHVRDSHKAVAEAARVLVRGGLYYVGVPNKLRLIGYLGSSDFKWSQKVHANFEDLVARYRGRFENEMGAHAGFTSLELQLLCAPHFDRFELLTRDFLFEKYGNRVPSWLLGRLTGRALGRIAPSHYAAAWK